MKCPRCGCKNPEGSKVCSSCSFFLLGLDTDEARPKRKIGRTVLFATIPAIIALVLMYFLDPIYVFILAVLGLPGAVKAILETRKHKASGWKKTLAIVTICISYVPLILGSYWKIDAAPIANDYTIGDLRSAPAEYNQTYDLLNSLTEADPNTAGAPTIGLSEAELETLRNVYSTLKKDDYAEICAALDANAAPILQLWQKSEKGRAIINKLDTFAEIADLSEPRIDAEVVFLKNLRTVTYVYHLDVCLQCQQGNGDAGLAELLRLDSVCTKIDKNARSIISKLVCMAIFTDDIRGANFIANNPRSPDELVEAVAAHFKSFSEGRLSLRNPVIFEYLAFCYELNNMRGIPKAGIKRSALLKLNSTVRLHWNFTDEWLDIEKGLSGVHKTRLSVWPSIYPELPVWIDSEGQTPWYYKAYNPIGSSLLEIFMPAMERIFQIRTKVRVENDLLQIVLNRRLGRPVSLKARAYGGEYIVDVKGKKIFSPGPDGKADTKDDIKLPINPEVLRWEE
jgi:hypothetical protein